MTTLTFSIELTDAQATGIAQARTAYNATEGATPLTDTEYLEFVLIGAANSYAAQYSGSEPVPPSPIAPVPRKVDARRLRLALFQLNLLTAIETAIAAQPRSAQIEWEFATDVKADHPLVVQLATTMSLDVDAIFDLAETYE